MNRITMTYYGVEGTGRTLTEAKKDAGRKIEESLSGDYTPTVLEWRGNAILVWREPSGWGHRYIVHDGKTVEGRVYACCQDTKEEATRSALNSLAQSGWSHFDVEDWAPEILRDRADIAEFKSWVKFQRRYRVAQGKGLNDNDAHAYACGSLGRPELIALVEA